MHVYSFVALVQVERSKIEVLLVEGIRNPILECILESLGNELGLTRYCGKPSKIFENDDGI